MIEGARIEADEGGWYLVLEGDFVEEAERYLRANDGRPLVVSIDPYAVRVGLLPGCQAVAAHFAEGARLAAEHQRDLDLAALDTEAEALREGADLARKAARENA